MKGISLGVLSFGCLPVVDTFDPVNHGAGITFSMDRLTFTTDGTTNTTAKSTKSYLIQTGGPIVMYECITPSGGADSYIAGLIKSGAAVNLSPSNAGYLWYAQGGGIIYFQGTALQSGVGGYLITDYVQVVLDTNAGTLTYYLNGGGGTFVKVGTTITGLTGTWYASGGGDNLGTGCIGTYNFSGPFTTAGEALKTHLGATYW